MNRNAKNRLRPALDALDNRVLPATGVTASVVGGVLMIQGTEAADVIQVTFRSLAGSRRGGPAGATGYVTVDGVRYRPVRFQGIIVHGRGGDDQIILSQRGASAIPIGIDAGAGNDTIVGGPGGEVLFGNDGDDQIWGGGGPDNLIGGEGRDTINGQIEPAPVPQFVAPPAPAPAPSPAPTPLPTPTPTPTPTPPRTTPSSSPAGVDLAAFASDVVTYANAERQKAGVGTVKVNAQLAQMAQMHAESMARLDTMEHTLPDAQYPGLRDRAQAVGYRFAMLGENIAYNFRDASTLTFSWMNSPGHRSNLLNPAFTEIGIGIARNSRGELYICQVLGQPL